VVKKILLFVSFLTLFSFLYLFFTPNSNFAHADACVPVGGTCTESGPQSTCCSGSCYNIATVGFTGVCKTFACVPVGNSCSESGPGSQCCSGACYNLAQTGFAGTCLTSPPKPGDSGISASCGTSANEVWTLDCIFPLLQRIIFWALTFAATIAVIMIIYSGIRLITSGGDSKSIDSAKKTLTFAVFGLILILLSFAIINLISYASGVSCIKLMGFSACL
jgi:hypothetical protein